MEHRRYVAAACQFSPIFGDPHSNVDRMASMAEAAVRAEPTTRLVVFPESATMGLPGASSSRRDSELRKLFIGKAEPVHGNSSIVLGETARRLGVYIATGFVEADPVIHGVIYNSSILISPDGEVILVHRKTHSSSPGLFKLGGSIETVGTAIGRLGLSICYDLWFPEFLRLQVLRGLDVHVNMTGNQSAFILGSTHFPIVRAAENGVFVISANAVADHESEGGIRFVGASCIVAPLGEILASAGQISEETIFGEIDLDRIKQSRAFLSTMKDRREDLYTLRPLNLNPDGHETLVQTRSLHGVEEV